MFSLKAIQKTRNPYRLRFYILPVCAAMDLFSIKILRKIWRRSKQSASHIRCYFFLQCGDERFHLVRFALHIRHQGKLVVGTDQVMLRISGLKVGVAVQVIGQKAHTALKGHQLGRKGQLVDLRLGQALPRRGQKALGISTDKTNIKIFA